MKAHMKQLFSGILIVFMSVVHAAGEVNQAVFNIVHGPDAYARMQESNARKAKLDANITGIFNASAQEKPALIAALKRELGNNKDLLNQYFRDKIEAEDLQKIDFLARYIDKTLVNDQALIEAARHKKHVVLRHFIEMYHQNPNVMYQDYSLLALAIGPKFDDFFKYLVPRMSKNTLSATLIKLIEHEKYGYAKKLIDEKRVNVNVQIYGVTPLIAAVKKNNVDLVKYLVAHGADVNQAGNEQNTPLLYAVRGHTPGQANNYSKEIIVHLLGHGADVSASNDKGETALSLATHYAQTSTNDFYKNIYSVIMRLLETAQFTAKARRISRHNTPRTIAEDITTGVQDITKKVEQYLKKEVGTQ
jgi:hypothetical protein